MTQNDAAMLLWPDGPITQPFQAGGPSPTLEVFAPAPDAATGAAVVVCPGGGYGMLAPHEAMPVVEWLISLGITGVLLRYRLAPHARHPEMLEDAQRAIRTVRAHANRWHVDPERIGILGFSAGGHLASTAATHFDAGDELCRRSRAAGQFPARPCDPDLSGHRPRRSLRPWWLAHEPARPDTRRRSGPAVVE